MISKSEYTEPFRVSNFTRALRLREGYVDRPFSVLKYIGLSWATRSMLTWMAPFKVCATTVPETLSAEFCPGGNPCRFRPELRPP